MKRTIPFVVSCLFLIGLYSLVPFSVQGAESSIWPFDDDSPSDTLFLQLNNCSDEAILCLDSLPLSLAIQMSITVNGEPYQKTLAGCNFDTISAYSYTTLFGGGDLGPYELTEWILGDTIFTGRFENIPDLVDSMNLWDPQGNWQLDEISQSISGGFGGNRYSPMKVLVVSINTPSVIGYNFGMEAIGTQLRFNQGIHNVLLSDTLNNMVTGGIVVVSCHNNKTIEKRLLIGDTQTECLDFSTLLTAPKIIAPIGSFNQENVTFQLINNDSCLTYSGSKVGVDTASIIVCDSLDFCDTTTFIIEAYDVPHYREVTINMPIGTSQSFCLDTSLLAAPINSFINDCPTKSEHINVTLEQAVYCATIEGMSAGQDTVCLQICNQIGLCDTTILLINVYNPPTTETIELTLIEKDSLEICLETTQLAGNITKIDNFCENNPSETIFFNINNVDLCFDVTALNMGVDSICTVICDNFLICDTTFYIISVVSSSTLSLTANPDQDTISVNSPTTINILGNDSIPDGVLTNMELYAPNGASINGTATINPDGTLNYSPNQDICAVSDEIGYIICNSAGCDTSKVDIYIQCVEPPSTTMKFYNGFSPNGDGINDRFTIDGIAQYPNNELVIVNRWGVKVYGMKGYKNAWDGTWNKKPLPDGTYFYLLRNGEGQEYSGSLQIRR